MMTATPIPVTAPIAKLHSSTTIRQRVQISAGRKSTLSFDDHHGCFDEFDECEEYNREVFTYSVCVTFGGTVVLLPLSLVSQFLCEQRNSHVYNSRTQLMMPLL